MTGPVARIGDPFDCGAFVAAGSSNVYVNFKPVARLGDAVTPHGCWSGSTIIAPCSATVFINGIPAAFVGSMNTPHVCPPAVHSGSIIVGSPDVFIGS